LKSGAEQKPPFLLYERKKPGTDFFSTLLVKPRRRTGETHSGRRQRCRVERFVARAEKGDTLEPRVDIGGMMSLFFD
jgi:hypothetical protein